MIIYHLVLLKDELHRIRNLKYKEFIEELSMTPLRINNYVHQIHIHYPYDERKEMTREREKEASDEAAFIQMILPVTLSRNLQVID